MEHVFIAPSRIGSSSKNMEHQDSVESSAPSGQGGGGNFLTPYNHPHTFPVSGGASGGQLSAGRMSSASNVTTGSANENGAENGDSQLNLKPVKVSRFIHVYIHVYYTMHV